MTEPSLFIFSLLRYCVITDKRLPSASPTLTKLHMKLDKLFKKKQELTGQLREELG